MSYLEDLLESFELERRRYVHIIGGGGKTTLMFHLARALSKAGRRVVTTTTARIRRPKAAESRVVLVEEDVGEAIEALRDAFESNSHVTIARHFIPDGQKLLGYLPDELDAVLQAPLDPQNPEGEPLVHTLLVEADGSKGRSLKAHAEWEPVVSSRADLVVAVLGTDALGCELSDEAVHRAERFAFMLGREVEGTVSADDIATVFFHPRGYLRVLETRVDVMVYLSKAGTGDGLRAAADLAQVLAEADIRWRVVRFVAGELKGRRFAEVLMDRMV